MSKDICGSSSIAQSSPPLCRQTLSPPLAALAKLVPYRRFGYTPCWFSCCTNASAVHLFEQQRPYDPHSTIDEWRVSLDIARVVVSFRCIGDQCHHLWRLPLRKENTCERTHERQRY